MSDAFQPEPSVPGAEQEVEVDLAAFLPDGVELGEVDEVVVETVDGDVEVVEVVSETVIVEVAEAQPDGVDLVALSQIERDLDAVDAAIAALDAGTYGLDPATGQPIDDAVLAADPTRLS